MQETDYEALYVRAKEQAVLPFFVSICPSVERSGLMNLQDWQAVLEGIHFREPLASVAVAGMLEHISDFSSGEVLLSAYSSRSWVAEPIGRHLLSLTHNAWELVLLSGYLPLISPLRVETIRKILSTGSRDGDLWLSLGDLCRYEPEVRREVLECLMPICTEKSHFIVLYRLGGSSEKLLAQSGLEGLGADFSDWQAAYEWETEGGLSLPVFNHLYGLATHSRDWKRLAEVSRGRERRKALKKLSGCLSSVSDACYLYRETNTDSSLNREAVNYLRLHAHGVSHWQEIYRLSGDDADFRSESVTRLQVLSETFSDLRWLAENTSVWDTERNALLLRMVSLGTTFEDLDWVYRRSKNKILDDLTLNKMSRLASGRSQCVYVWDYLDVFGRSAQAMATRFLSE